jgi:FlaA1/EpsC-like NDP-sugar epimerase
MIPVVHLARRLSDLPPRVKLAIMLSADALALPVCVLAAVAFRLGSFADAWAVPFEQQVALAWLTIPVLAVAGLYQALVRFIDLRVLVSAGAALAVAIVGLYVVAWVFEFGGVPRASLFIYWFVAFAWVVSSRFVARALLRRGVRPGSRPRIRTAIYGAGTAGAQLAQAMLLSPEYKPVAFIDDRKVMHRKSVGGLKVYPSEALADLIFRHDIGQIVVAIPSASSAQKRRLIERVERAGVPVKILPSISELVGGTSGVAALREVDVADLLGRDPVPPDATLFARNLAGKSVLVTGAGGSIGSELCRQIVSQRPSRLVLLDHSEFALYTIDEEMKRLAPGVPRAACLGSVLDDGLMRRTIAAHGVQTIYHAAAYKHVPIVEANMREGVRNNVFGSMAVARAALEAGVQTCVLVSTDKAVRPTNVMGASKRVAELVFQAAALRAAGRTTFSMVRFGNVLGSSGSVVPLFRQQIREGGPVTVTHPEIIRYFMLIPEAAQLVIQAGAMARGGEVFVLDMGEPVKILDLARSMIRLSGLTERTPSQPDGDIEIQVKGLRPGEKLYEELLIGEDVTPSGHPRIMSARERHVDPALLDKMLKALQLACDSNEPEALLRQMRNLVPEFRPADEVNAEASAALLRT